MRVYMLLANDMHHGAHGLLALETGSAAGKHLEMTGQPSLAQVSCGVWTCTTAASARFDNSYSTIQHYRSPASLHSRLEEPFADSLSDLL